MGFAAVTRGGRKLGSVLAGARVVFLRDGFEGASVDDIVREAGVSKATLYSYFPDKRALFAEMVRIECQRQAEAALRLIDMSEPPRIVLREAAHHLVGFITSEVGSAIFRICVAECPRFPEIGREFFASGPMLVSDRLSEYLHLSAARGELLIDDFELAAEQFAELCRANLHTRLLLGVKTRFSAKEKARTVDGAVSMFLARYAAPRAAA